MSKKPELLLVGVRAELEALLGAAFKGVARIAQSIPDYQRLQELDHGGANQIVLVDIDADPEQGFRAVSALSAKQPQRPIVVISESKDSNQVLQAMRAGARDYAVLEPGYAEVLRATTTLARERTIEPTGKVIAIFPAKGGSGATTVATNLAAAMKKKKDLRVVLLDLDLEMGDSLLFLDVASRYSIADAIRSHERLDAELLGEVITKHQASGLHILSQTGHVEDADVVTPERIIGLIDFLRRHYDVVIVDGVRGFDSMSLAALDASDQILLVLTQDVPGVKNARRCLNIFDRLDYGEERVKVVLNRAKKGHDIDIPAIEDTLNRTVAAQIANDFPTVMGAINRGDLLSEVSPKARVTEDMSRLVGVALGEEEEPEKKGVFSNLFAKKR
jgi:pilus assembly protein CpaE